MATINTSSIKGITQSIINSIQEYVLDSRIKNATVDLRDLELASRCISKCSSIEKVLDLYGRLGQLEQAGEFTSQEYLRLLDEMDEKIQSLKN